MQTSSHTDSKKTIQTPIDEILPFITMATNFFIHRLMPFVLSSFLFLDTNAFFVVVAQTHSIFLLLAFWFDGAAYHMQKPTHFSFQIKSTDISIVNYCLPKPNCTPESSALLYDHHML